MNGELILNHMKRISWTWILPSTFRWRLFRRLPLVPLAQLLLRLVPLAQRLLLLPLAQPLLLLPLAQPLLLLPLAQPPSLLPVPLARKQLRRFGTNFNFPNSSALWTNNSASRRRFVSSGKDSRPDGATPSASRRVTTPITRMRGSATGRSSAAHTFATSGFILDCPTPEIASDTRALHISPTTFKTSGES